MRLCWKRKEDAKHYRYVKLWIEEPVRMELNNPDGNTIYFSCPQLEIKNYDCHTKNWYRAEEQVLSLLKMHNIDLDNYR